MGPLEEQLLLHSLGDGPVISLDLPHSELVQLMEFQLHNLVVIPVNLQCFPEVVDRVLWQLHINVLLNLVLTVLHHTVREGVRLPMVMLGHDVVAFNFDLGLFGLNFFFNLFTITQLLLVFPDSSLFVEDDFADSDPSDLALRVLNVVNAKNVGIEHEAQVPLPVHHHFPSGLDLYDQVLVVALTEQAVRVVQLYLFDPLSVFKKFDCQLLAKEFLEIMTLEVDIVSVPRELSTVSSVTSPVHSQCQRHRFFIVNHKSHDIIVARFKALVMVHAQNVARLLNPVLVVQRNVSNRLVLIMEDQ